MWSVQCTVAAEGKYSAADFRAFADVLDAVRAQGQVVVLGGQEAIEKMNAARPGWLKVVKVL